MVISTHSRLDSSVSSVSKVGKSISVVAKCVRTICNVAQSVGELGDVLGNRVVFLTKARPSYQSLIGDFGYKKLNMEIQG